MEGSLWQRNEQIHRRVIFDEESRQELQESIIGTENHMLSMIGKNDFQPSRDELKAADDLVRGWMDQWYEKLKNETIHYPSMSLYGQFWKYTNEREALF